MPLAELAESETLQGLDGLAVVLGVSLSRVSQPVYNIEIHGEHVYQVGELGILVHNNYLQEAIARGMKVLRGPPTPDELVGVMDILGRPISRVQIGDVIHKVKADVTVGLGAADDIVFDLSGGIWNSRNGEPIEKIWEWL